MTKTNVEINEEATNLLRAFGETQVPMINFCEPVVTDLSDRACTVVLPLNHKTKNHLGSMYFGAINVGADCAAGLLAMHHIQKSGHAISLVFKSSTAEYLKRPEGDVHFTCTDGDTIEKMVNTVVQTKERAHAPLKITATVPSLLGDTPVAELSLTLSLKCLD